MAWRIEFARTAEKQIIKLGPKIQRAILKYLKERVLTAENPHSLGKGLKGEKIGLWRYHIGAYRLICIIDDERKMITALSVGHRKDVYEK